MKLQLADPVAAVAGIGSRTAAVLAGQGIHSVADLLWHLPYRWEDRANPLPLREVQAGGGAVTVRGELVELRLRRLRGRLSLVEAAVSDGETALPVVWFNQPYLAKTLKLGQRLWLHGAPRLGRGWGVELHAPEWEVERDDGEALHHGRIVPIYRKIGSLTCRRLRQVIGRTLTQLDGTQVDPLAAELGGPPGALTLTEALALIHFPPAPANGEERRRLLDELQARTSAAHRRLAQQELVELAVALERARRGRHLVRAEACVITAEIRAKARAALPFPLTRAQRRVVQEIVADLQRPIPMARLLHGEVGAGKTVVAALAALVVAESGAQTAILAPTELLAQQHQTTFARFLDPTGHRPVRLVGSLSEREKRAVRASLERGDARVVVGTHALLEESVNFARLGLAIIDEQHRFGVAQRQRLVGKGRAPHLLVMTATPIPRSLALALYGDLEVSVLDELPPGRQPVRTVVREGSARPRVLEFVAREVAEGGQAYWVFPFIEGDEEVPVRSVTRHTREVQRGLPGVGVGVIHGGMPTDERAQVMAAFAAGDIAVLCATTIVEVGVDVPRASVMVVENAERFGLAQLHQLRGRVGRGRRRAYCVLLLGEACPPPARERLARFATLADGFAVAEEDFRLRGPGEITGLRQWGRGELIAADLCRHLPELEEARWLARRWAERGHLEELARLLGGGGRSVGPA